MYLTEVKQIRYKSEYPMHFLEFSTGGAGYPKTQHYTFDSPQHFAEHLNIDYFNQTFGKQITMGILKKNHDSMYEFMEVFPEEIEKFKKESKKFFRLLNTLKPQGKQEKYLYYWEVTDFPQIGCVICTPLELMKLKSMVRNRER